MERDELERTILKLGAMVQELKASQRRLQEAREEHPPERRELDPLCGFDVRGKASREEVEQILAATRRRTP